MKCSKVGKDIVASTTEPNLLTRAPACTYIHAEIVQLMQRTRSTINVSTGLCDAKRRETVEQFVATPTGYSLEKCGKLKRSFLVLFVVNETINLCFYQCEQYQKFYAFDVDSKGNDDFQRGCKFKEFES